MVSVSASEPVVKKTWVMPAVTIHGTVSEITGNGKEPGTKDVPYNDGSL